MDQDVYCVIMAGGIGKRFWPVSNQNRPKQFLDILQTGKSFIRQTYERIRNTIPNERIFIITGSEYAGITQEQIPELLAGNILKEPIRRNTATCIMYAASKIKRLSPTATMVIIPSDHFISNDMAYLEDIRSGVSFVNRNGGLLTFGIRPSRVETEYGYIQVRNNDDEKISVVKTFTEKPDYDMAQKFYESGEFLWNTGVFIWKVQEIIDEIMLYIYDLYYLFEHESQINTPEEEAFIRNVYAQCPNMSIDFGILEKSNRVFVLKGNFGWSDVGTWHVFRALSQKDDAGNTANTPHVVFRESKDCTVNVPEEKKVIVFGVNDLIVAEKNSYLMICDRKREEQIKNFEKMLDNK